MAKQLFYFSFIVEVADWKSLLPYKLGCNTGIVNPREFLDEGD